MIAPEVDRRGPSAIHLTMSEALVSENRIARVFWRSIFERVASISRRMSPRMVCWSFCSKKCFYSYMFLDFSAPWEEEDVPLEWSPEISVKKWKGWRKSAESGPAAEQETINGDSKRHVRKASVEPEHLPSHSHFFNRCALKSARFADYKRTSWNSQCRRPPSSGRFSTGPFWRNSPSLIYPAATTPPRPPTM